MKYCFAEISGDGEVLRIFHNLKNVSIEASHHISRIPYKKAVGAIRYQVYQRAKGSCERCGKLLTWDQMHMDEKISRGEGGPISLDNCWCLCADCHILRPESEHGERRWGGKNA